MKEGTNTAPHLSHSQITEFVQCPRKYHLHRRLGLEPEFVPAGLLFGSAMHEALAMYHQRRLEGTQATLGQLCQVFDGRWGEDRLQVRYGPLDNERALRDKARRMLALYLEDPQCCGDVLAVEEPFRLAFSPGLPPVHGRIDLIEATTDGGLVVTDFKTAKSRSAPRSGQLVLYREAVTAMGYPGNAQVKARYVLLLKTAKPGIVVHEPQVAERDVEKLRALYEGAWESIGAGHSYPRAGWWCSGCQWQRYCDDV